MDCIKAGILSHISRICLNDEPMASDDRPHATLAWAYPPNISFSPSGPSTMKNMLRSRRPRSAPFLNPMSGLLGRAPTANFRATMVSLVPAMPAILNTSLENRNSPIRYVEPECKLRDSRIPHNEKSPSLTPFTQGRLVEERTRKK
ncbi:Phosphatidylinositol 4,5-bisphosphate 3-kinase catalytic subunit alphaisoform [Striga asiatica]|uniref:Phosphatidylinositol 4,5-bisphosphate 3-kinase catalytic subunit alphaisoform n=1 Tax=Striga asiatica TaxID=4170 RepID=A0A5A7Q026_STRAF|nr:Phosphatidylinositol 4,5-bisphosphate 3-kinase catalytic subunit alphaisoform [Striga asiatica]